MGWGRKCLDGGVDMCTLFSTMTVLVIRPGSDAGITAETSSDAKLYLGVVKLIYRHTCQHPARTLQAFSSFLLNPLPSPVVRT